MKKVHFFGARDVQCANHVSWIIEQFTLLPPAQDNTIFGELLFGFFSIIIDS